MLIDFVHGGKTGGSIISTFRELFQLGTVCYLVTLQLPVCTVPAVYCYCWAIIPESPASCYQGIDTESLYLKLVVNLLVHMKDQWDWNA